MGAHAIQDMILSIIDDVVLDSVCDTPRTKIDRTVAKEALSHLEFLSSCTYEGDRISAAIGISSLASGRGAKRARFADLLSTDYHKVLSNGVTTLIESDSQGHVRGIYDLDSVDVDVTKERPLCPSRFQRLAVWSSREKGLAFVLTRNGEILVFLRGRLEYVLRRGKWFRNASTEMVRDRLRAYIPYVTRPRHDRTAGTRRHLRSRILDSCIDVSFARCGGCIGVIDRATLDENPLDEILTDGDRWDTSSDELTKGELLRGFLHESFPTIPRNVRQSMLAMDGATLIDKHTGAIIASGAILRNISPDIEGGGRTAAAKELGRRGLGIKISEDGTISMYRDTGRRLSDGSPAISKVLSLL